MHPSHRALEETMEPNARPSAPAVRPRRALAFAALLGAVLVSPALTPAAHAQPKSDDSFSLDDEGSAPRSAAAPAPEPTPQAGPTLLSDEQALAEEQAPEEKFRQSTDPWEDPKKSYFFAGAAWRYVRMPSWVLDWFLDSAPSVGTAGSLFGEFGYRHDGFQVTAQVGWLKYAFKGPFQLSGDPVEDTEWLNAKFNTLMGTATFTWSTAFTDWFALEYGVEAGIGALLGKMTRTEAVKDGSGWRACPTWASQPGGPVNPAFLNPTAAEQRFCDAPLPPEGSSVTPASNAADEIGAHYGIASARGIANSGVPYVLPIVGPRLSLRFKPIHQLVLRVDVPLPLLPFGFVGGLGAQFGF
jgi:hypothetical protein